MKTSLARDKGRQRYIKSQLIVSVMMATCIATSSMAQAVPGERQTSDPDCLIALDAISSPTPKFEAFHERSVWNRKPAEVDLKSDPDAAMFRTVLSKGAKLGPNFAGHYTIVGWRCGTSCANFAVVDAKSGKVNFPPELQRDNYGGRSSTIKLATLGSHRVAT